MANFKTGGDQIGYEADYNALLALNRTLIGQVTGLQGQINTLSMKAKAAAATAPTTPVYSAQNTGGTSLSNPGYIVGMVKGTGSGFAVAVAGTDYLAPFAVVPANAVFAGPVSGTTGAAPAFRALVTADLPPGTGSGGGAVFGASGTAHAPGIVPDPGATAGTSRFLREDATFAVPPGTSSGSSVPRAAFRVVLMQGANPAAVGALGEDIFPADENGNTIWFVPTKCRVRCETPPTGSGLSVSSEWSSGAGAFATVYALDTKTVAAGNREPTRDTIISYSGLTFPKTGDKCRANVTALNGAAGVTAVQEFTLYATDPSGTL